MNKFEKIFREAKPIKDYIDDGAPTKSHAYLRAMSHAYDQKHSVMDYAYKPKVIKGEYFTLTSRIPTVGDNQYWTVKVNSAPEYKNSKFSGETIADAIADFFQDHDNSEGREELQKFLSALSSTGVTLSELEDDWRDCFRRAKKSFETASSKVDKAFDNRVEKIKNEWDDMNDR